jgi:putative tricarboxylic transport membrane protein
MIERAVNAVWVLIGTAGVTVSWNMGLTGPGGPDSGLFPLIASVVVLAGGVLLMLSPRQWATDIGWPDRAGWMRLGGVVFGLATIAITLPLIGFIAAGLLTMMILMRTVERASWLQSVALAAGSVAVVTGLFGHLLGMPLPRGPWGF